MVKKQKFRILITIFFVTLIIVAIKGLVPKSKAGKPTSIEITYKAGTGKGENVITTQDILDWQTQITLSKNNEFDGGTVEVDEHTYQKVLTGWKLTSITENGVKTNVNSEEIYAQNGLYTVPDGITAIEFTAVYGRAIYVRSPYDKMNYDEYHIFVSGENANSDGEQNKEQSSDENYGTSSEDAVSTLKRAYELIEDDASKTVYDNVVVLCGDLYEINYNIDGSDYVVDNAGTYKNYSSDNLGYQTSTNKPITITSDENKKYSLYLGAADEEIASYSSLRFDNIYIKSLPEENVSDIHGTDITIDTYLKNADLRFFSTGIFEATENLTTEETETNLLYGNLSEVKLNSGNWNPVIAKDATEITDLSKNNCLQIGGTANISKLAIRYKNSSENATLTNVPTIKITGGKIAELVAIEDIKINENANVFVYGGKIDKAYGTDNFSLVFDKYNKTTKDSQYASIETIDGWQNVILKDSHLIIDNQLENVSNLSVPDGSGLKLSNDTEIAGNFTGGGELYLDNDICLTIDGDITGTTKLILNPSVINGKNIIVGGINHPYLKVKGSSKSKSERSVSDEIVSGESKYTILTQKGDYSYYYIENDVELSNFVEVKSTNVADKVYKGSLGNSVGSDANDISILEIDSYTQDIELNYEFYKNSIDTNKYSNINRQFVLKKDKQSTVNIPKGTEILMIYNGKNYNYLVDNNSNSIELSAFKDEEGNSFKQVSNLQTAEGVNKETNNLTGDTLYNYSEKFRFIVSFANIISNNNSIEAGSYYSIINILDSGTWIDSEQMENTNKVNISQVLFTPNTIQTEQEKYEKNGIVSIKSKGTVKTYNGDGKQLYGNIRLYKSGSQNQRIDIPVGSKISLNDEECEIINGTTQCKFLDNCTSSGTSYNFDFKMDMTNVLEQNQLHGGEYKIVFDYAFAQVDLLNGNIAGWLEVPLTIIDYSDNYGLDVSVENVGDLAKDKLQLITKGTEELRTINIKCSGQLDEPVIKITALEKTNDFEYSTTDNSQKIIIKNNVDSTSINGNCEVTFSKSLAEGTYRIMFELYDKYGTKKTKNFVNFIVVDKPKI